MQTTDIPVSGGLLTRAAGYLVTGAVSLVVGVAGTHVATLSSHGERLAGLEIRADATAKAVDEIRGALKDILSELRGRK